MARHFQQVHTAPALAKLLSHSNKTIVDSAIRALSGLEAFDAVNDVVSIAGSNWNNEKVCKSIITYLSKTGHSVTHHDLLTQYLAHEMVLVRLEAVRALYQLGDIGKTMLQQHAATRPGEIEPLIEHVAEPLLR
jgi:HEAT repeat protein